MENREKIKGKRAKRGKHVKIWKSGKYKKRWEKRKKENHVSSSGRRKGGKRGRTGNPIKKEKRKRKRKREKEKEERERKKKKSATRWVSS